MSRITIAGQEVSDGMELVIDGQVYLITHLMSSRNNDFSKNYLHIYFVPNKSLDQRILEKYKRGDSAKSVAKFLNIKEEKVNAVIRGAL